MLRQMRSFTRSWIAYVLLFVLAVAFAIWGVNDVFSGTGSRNVAQVGGAAITPAQLSRELDIELRNIRANGGSLSQQDAVNEGMHRALLERLIARQALTNYAEKIGVHASNAQVAEYIRTMAPTQNPVTGTFDEAAYDNLLRQLRFTRPEFEHEIRGDLTRQMALEALAIGVRTPSSFGAIALAYDGESRVVSIAQAPMSLVGAVPAPNDAQLQAFWEESQEMLRVPEFRALTLVYARPADFLARVDVPEARLREEFEARRAALTQPERRSYVRLSAQTEEQANDAAARINRGETPDAVATALSLQITRGDNQTRAEVPDARVAEAVFAAPARQARAVRGQLAAWVVVRVETITAPVAPNLAAIHDELRDAIAHDEAAELLNTAVSGFEDARSGGASIVEAARQNGLTVVSVAAVEAGGRDPNGAPVAALQDQQELLRTAFQTPEGEASDFMPVGDADVIVSVDGITPARVRALDEVRADLTQAWIQRERGRRLREMTDEMIAAVRGGQSFAAAARARRFELVVPSQEVNRRASAQIPARSLSSQIFAAAEGDVVSDSRIDGGAILVAVVERINRINPAEHPQEVEAARARMQVDNPFTRAEDDGVAPSFGESLQNEIVHRANVRRNERLIDQTFRATNAEEEEAQ